jgi:phosphoribosylformimino-5-aminoimidazole carboxamide ribotide isomerase
MQLYPAIDLRAGHVVRLLQGDFAREKRYLNDAVDLAREYEAAGAEWLHVVDLDGAKGDVEGSAANLLIIEQIARVTRLQVQSGGGVRSPADVGRRLAAGIARVVIGSMAIKAPELAFECLQNFGADKLALALDARADDSVSADSTPLFRVHISGWQERAETELFACLQNFAGQGFKHALVTDISLDGMLSGPNLALYHALAQRFPKVAIQASGGVATLADLKALRAQNAAGAIIGKALLEGRFSLADAILETAL